MVIIFQHCCLNFIQNFQKSHHDSRRVRTGIIVYSCTRSYFTLFTLGVLQFRRIQNDMEGTKYGKSKTTIHSSLEDRQIHDELPL